MNLSLRVNEDATEEEDKTANGKDERSEQLYVEFLFHGAKLQQKSEPTKKAGSEKGALLKSSMF